MPLEKGILFGPYEGVITNTTKMSGYGWQIKQRSGPQFCVDAWDPRVSNWMRYVKCARYKEEQNLIAFQFKGQIYYRTLKDVPMQTELLVWYRGEYGLELGIDKTAFLQSDSKLVRSAEQHKGLSYWQILSWIFIVLDLTLVAVLLWLVAGVNSSLSARNQALTNQNLALHRTMHALQDGLHYEKLQKMYSPTHVKEQVHVSVTHEANAELTSSSCISSQPREPGEDSAVSSLSTEQHKTLENIPLQVTVTDVMVKDSSQGSSASRKLSETTELRDSADKQSSDVDSTLDVDKSPELVVGSCS